MLGNASEWTCSRYDEGYAGDTCDEPACEGYSDAYPYEEFAYPEDDAMEEVDDVSSDEGGCEDWYEAEYGRALGGPCPGGPGGALLDCHCHHPYGARERTGQD